MGKKIAVLITDEFEDSEFTSPAEAFRKAGHEVVTIEKEAVRRTIFQRLTAKRYACSVRNQCSFLPKPRVLSVNFSSSRRISHTGAFSAAATGKRRV